MAKTFDVIVLGLGANGSSALYDLSKTNLDVLGIDRFTPPHSFGSSHGESRIIRQAYQEGPMYVPFVKQAYALWQNLENEAAEPLFLKTGSMMLGAEDASVIKGAILSSEEYGIAFEYLNHNELQKKFPAFRSTENTVGVLEQEAGILFPEKCIKTYLELAHRNGAQLRLNEKVISIKPKGDRIEITASNGVYLTEKLIISAGAWVGELVPELNLPLKVARQVLFWFENKNAQLQPFLMPHHMPVYIWEYSPGKMFYGFPDIGNGIKIAYHYGGAQINPDELTQVVTDHEIADMQNIVNSYLRIDAAYSSSAVCMYTNTPDENFIIDYHPEHKNIIVASPCSGHGFKFSSLTGKILSDMATGKKIDFDISPFRIDRQYV